MASLGFYVYVITHSLASLLSHIGDSNITEDSSCLAAYKCLQTIKQMLEERMIVTITIFSE